MEGITVNFIVGLQGQPLSVLTNTGNNYTLLIKFFSRRIMK